MNIPNQPLRCLLVEDDQNDAMLLLRALRIGGYDVVWERVETAAAMQAALDRQPWDAIISDFQMPQFTGLAALELLHASGLDLPFIIVSGTIGEDVAVSTMKAGAHDYLMKGNLARLVPALERELRDATARRKREQAAEALRESEAMLKESQRIARLGSYVFDITNNQWRSSEVLDSIFGIDATYDHSQAGWAALIHPDDRAMMENYFLEDVVERHHSFDRQYRIIRPNDQVERWLHGLGNLEFDAHGRPAKMIGTILDITEHRLMETYREMCLEVLSIFIESADLKDSMHRVITSIKSRSGLDAVGLRLLSGEDFPYFAQLGFSESFLLTENSLLGHTATGEIRRDCNGYANLECACGLVISGKTDPTSPFCTPGGSFWTNNAFPLRDLPLDQDPRHHPRNQCVHHGYASLALVPIRTKHKIVGLLQLNDRRHGCFSLALIQQLESVAAHIGDALMRVQAEENLRRSHELLALAQRSSGSGLWDWDIINGPLNWTPELFHLFGMDPETSSATFDAWRECLHPDDLKAAEERIDNAIRDHTRLESDYRIVLPSGELRWIHTSGSTAYDTAGQPLHMAGLCIDTTERKRTEVALHLALAEKISLVKEIHHRVKNNLAIMISLINMQARQIQHPEVLAALADTKARLFSMSLLHEMLYRSGQMDRVDVKGYLEGLCGHLEQSLGLATQGIQILSRLPDALTLEIDQAVPCGLIVSELVSNAIKHAFPDARTGQIRVELVLEQPDTITLCVADNGIGLPDDLKIDQVISVGLTLVNSLTLQLGGTLTIRSEHGTLFDIRFKHQPATLP
ncbi:MAG: hypothetical protein RLZZ282_672 [Verrucomicrobiota bacterium]